MELNLGDVVRLRKKHPCGSEQWEVVRLGADIGLKCQGCGRRILMERVALERHMKGEVMSSGEKVAGPSQE